MTAALPFRGRLVGRDSQLDELRAALLAAQHGRGQLVLLSGEAGIGKTRLAEEADSIGRAHGTRVLWGRCHQIEGRPPFWPWVQILRSYTLDTGAEQVASQLAADTLPLAQLVPELQPHLRPTSETAVLDSDSARFRLFLGLAAILRQAAQLQPLLLILDDIHWADMPSLRLLDFLSHELSEAPIVVIASYRHVDLQNTPSLAEIVTGLARRAHHIALGGFSLSDAAAFVAAASSPQISATWAARLHEITEGNPFYLDEMLRLLDALGGELPASGWSLPQGIAATIKQRLQVLPAEVVRLLAAGAVAGRELDLVLLEGALEVPRATLLQQLRPAIDGDIVRARPDQPARFRFSHALLQEALRLELPADQRAALHRRCGEILEARHHGLSDDAGVSGIAYHFYEAALHAYDPKAVDYAARAGEQALEALAFEEAITQFSRALQLLELAPQRDPQRECGLLLRLGKTANHAAQGALSVDAHQRAAALARQIGAPLPLARAAIGLCGVGSTWSQFGRYDSELVAVLREALDGLPADEFGLRARVTARLATELHFAPTRVDTDALSAQAVDLARRAGDAATLISTLPARLRCSTPDQTEERQEIIREILDLTGGRGELAIHALVWRLYEALQAGAMAEVEECRAILLASVNEQRQPRDRWIIPVLQSQRLVLEGRFDEAEKAAQAILEQEGLTPNAQMVALVLVFLIRREQGRLGELAENMRFFAYRSSTVTAWRTFLAQLYAETGAEEAARAEVDVLVDEGLTCLRRDNTWILGVAGLAVATASVGTPEQAAMIYRTLQPYDGRRVVAASFFYVGPVSYYLGILAARQGMRDTALRHLDAAVATARSVGALPCIARSLVARAHTLEMEPQADAAAAANLRRQAVEIAERLGLTAVALAAGRNAGAPAAVVSGTIAERVASLRSAGTSWLLTYMGRTSILKARVGLDYLGRLLSSPGEELHVLDLAGGSERRPLPAGTPEAVLDPRAKQELRVRLEDLRAELEEAEAHHDLLRAEKMRAEIEAIGEHLAQAIGLGGRDRRVNVVAERARAAVTKALRAAIREIAESEPDLADILTRTVRTGAFCSYMPIKDVALTWVIESAGD